MIFRNVTVVNASGRERRDVFVEDGKIVGPFEDLTVEGSTARVIDASGKFLIPGVIDSHVHFRDPGFTEKEDWASGSRAAAAGGVTTVLDMPNTNPPTVTVAALEEKRKIAQEKSVVNFGLFMGAAGENDEELRHAKNIAGIKIYMGSSTGELLLDKPEAWERIFKIAKEKNVPVVVHAEDEKRIQERMVEFAGHNEARTHAEIRDCECAVIATRAALELRKKIGNKLHLGHMTCKEEVDLVRRFADPNLSCEVTPHHLFFTEEDMKDSFLKMNPPLRHKEDLLALWKALRDGTVTCLATDHAPHLREEKSQVHWKAPAGVPSVEFLLALFLNEANENMLPFERLVELLCAGPARIFSLKRKGEIREGMDADLVLIDMEIEKTITEADVKSKCGWTPYLGYKLKGWPVMTVVNGKVVMENGLVL